MADDIYISKNQQPKKELKPEKNDVKSQKHPPDKKPANDTKKKNKSKSIFNKLVIALSVFLVLIIATGGIFVYFTILGNINYTQESDRTNEHINEGDLFSNKDVTNILLIGVDSISTQDTARSDSMILLTIDKKTKSIKLTSFLRDMWVQIPGRQMAKINAASAYGGAELVLDTIEYNFNIQIDNYVMVGFDVFESIIDAIGGLNMDISDKEAKEMKNFDCIVETGNDVLLNGEQALWYARIRKIDSDFHRTARQREIIEKVIEKLKKTKVTTLIDIVSEIAPLVETDIPRNELVKLGMGSLFSYLRYDIKQTSIPADGMWKNATIKSQSVLQINLEQNREYLKDFLYE